VRHYELFTDSAVPGIVGQMSELDSSLVARIGRARVIVPALVVFITAQALFHGLIVPGFAEATGGLAALDV